MAPGNGAGQPGANNSYRGQARNDIRVLPPYGIGAPGSVVQTGGGGTPFFRNGDDLERSMWRRTPEAMFPDGYLGVVGTSSIVSRQNDRMLQALRQRTSDRSYTRGIHAGERIDQIDYTWPAEFTPMNGLKAEAAGKRQAPLYGANYPTQADIALTVNNHEGVQNIATLAPNSPRSKVRHLAPQTKW